MYKITMYRVTAHDLVFFDTSYSELFDIAIDEMYNHKTIYGFSIVYERRV